MAQDKIHQMVTERIIDKLQDAINAAKNGNAVLAPWHCPWFQTGIPMNLVSKRPYRGMNVFILSMMGYASPYFLSFNQAKKLGGKIKKGEKGIPVVFWKWVEVSKDKDGNELKTAKKIPFLRYYTVFNISQTEGVDEKKIPIIPVREFNPIKEGDRIIENMPNCPTMTHEQARAFYRPVTDTVNMPKHELFDGDAEYYSTCFHELAHSTGHTSRLNRKEVMDGNSFASHDYSIEELVAEMTAVFLCNHIGIESTFDNSVAYLSSWLKRLKDDTKMLITASGRAQKAFDYILNESPESPETENDENNKTE
jgi:antirestriction protein ArdC